jgi:hypothetical protein
MRTIPARASGATRPHRSDQQPTTGTGLRLATAAGLAYGGGAVLFWLHAVARHEAGPALSYPKHWLLDSTLALVVLTPLTLAAFRSSDRGGRHPSAVAARAAALVAVATTPGPALHNALVGGGTTGAAVATAILGADPDGAAPPPGHAHASLLAEILLQLIVALPTYVAVALLIRAATALARHRRTTTAPRNTPP